MRARICVAFLALRWHPRPWPKWGLRTDLTAAWGMEATWGWAGIAVLTPVLPSEDLRRIAFTASFGLPIPTTGTQWWRRILDEPMDDDPSGVRHQLWYDPAKHIYYYYH